MPMQTLDLTFAPEDDAAFRGRWKALQDAGLPSMADHKGSSNAPHVTLVSAPVIPEEVVDRAREFFAERLPMEMGVGGLLVLGSKPGKYVLADLVLPPAALYEVMEELQGLMVGFGLPLRPWTPHLTLAKQLTTDQVARAVEILGGGQPLIAATAGALRRWEPIKKVLTIEVSLSGT